MIIPLLLICLLSLRFPPEGNRREIRNAGGLSDVRTIAAGVPDHPISPPSSSPPARDEGIATPLWNLSDENAIAEHLSLSADGKICAIGFTLNSDRFEMRTADSGSLILQYPCKGASGWTALSADGQRAAFAGVDTAYLFVLPHTEPSLRVPMPGCWAGAVAVSRDGSLAVVTGNRSDRTVNSAWGIIGDSVAWRFDVDAMSASNWFGVSFTDDNRLVVLTAKYRLWVLDPLTGAELWSCETYNTESPAGHSGDGSMIAIASLSGQVMTFLRDATGWHPYWEYRFRDGDASWGTSVVISADGSGIAAAGLNFYADSVTTEIVMFDAYGDGAPKWDYRGFADEVDGLKLSADGSLLAASSWGDVEQQTPDFALFERHSAVPFYSLITPGSMGEVGLSDDGSRVIVGGKATHNRVFGKGGLVYCLDTDRPGGVVSGRVTDEADNPIANVMITGSDNPYSAITDASGRYLLPVEVADGRTLNVTAHKQGFIDGVIEDVVVFHTEETKDVDFRLSFAGSPPAGFMISHMLPNRIGLQWDSYSTRRDGIYTAPRAGLTPEGETGFATTTPRGGMYPPPTMILVYRSLARDRGFTRIASLPRDCTSYDDAVGLLPERDYYYAVTADFGNGESAFSPVKQARLDGSYLNWSADLTVMPFPQLDGRIESGEWDNAEQRDISDSYGYDVQDSAGTVTAWIGCSTNPDRLLIAARYNNLERLVDGMGLGVYVDDNGDSVWNSVPSGGEGNYWGYWIDGAPVMRYRSLTGPPYDTKDTYYIFDNPELAFGEDDGHPVVEMAIPLGWRNLYDVALSAPAFSIGLGLFALTYDSDSSAQFLGWWPQDMVSIVTYPRQFARVKLPVKPIVPPAAPESLTVVRTGDSLAVGWNPPAKGVDGGALTWLAGYQLFRNELLIATLDSGVASYVDRAVSPRGWYEYRINGYINDPIGLLAGTASPSVGEYAEETPEPKSFSRDDGSREAYFVVGYEGEDNRFAARFDVTGLGDSARVYWVDMLIGNTTPFEVGIARDNDGLPALSVPKRYRTHTDTSGTWHRFHFPGTDQPIVYGSGGIAACWVVMYYSADNPGDPPIGVDQSNHSPTYNAYHMADGGWASFGYGQLMIRLGVVPAGDTTASPPIISTTFSVGQNYPNPFNGMTLIPVDIPQGGVVVVDIFDINGKKVTSFTRSYPPGSHKIPVSPVNLSTGVYFVRVKSVSGERIIKTALVK